MMSNPFDDDDEYIITDTGTVSRREVYGGGHAYAIKGRVPPGRPTEKQWQEALCRLVARVGRDGLPPGPNRQAQLVDWLREEFEHLRQNCEPADSALKERARFMLQVFDAGQ